MSFRAVVLRVLIRVGVLAAPSSGLWADSVRDANNALATQAVSLTEVFSASDSVATGYFRYFNEGAPPSRFSTYRLPLKRYPTGSEGAFRLFFGGAVGYFELNQEEEWLGARIGRLKIDCFSASAGPGFDWAPTDWLTFSPHAPVFYAYERFRFSPEGALGEGVARLVPNWASHDVGMSPALAVRTRWWLGAVEYGLAGRFTAIFSRSLGGEGATPDIRPGSFVWRNEAYARWHTPWEIRSCPTALGVSFARHDLAGDLREGGFLNHFYEVRSGLALDTGKGLAGVDCLDWLHEVELSAAYYFGERFSGVSVGVSFGF